MNKYHSKKITVDGETFDSKKEYNRYQELKLMEKAGLIRNIKRQKKYMLIPSQYGENGKVIEREVSYKADFVYFDIGLNKCVVEDTKGFRTKDYIIKRKLMLFVHGIRIVEV